VKIWSLFTALDAHGGYDPCHLTMNVCYPAANTNDQNAALGTMPNLTKCFYLGSQWTALKPTVVSTRNRGTADFSGKKNTAPWQGWSQCQARRSDQTGFCGQCQLKWLVKWDCNMHPLNLLN
jgi:hypothetical protein